MKSRETATQRFEQLAKLMDSQFRVPGTNIRFGLDPVIGLIPGGGDFVSFIISALMLSMLARKGASGYLLARMTMNILIDTLIGSIPVLGDIFDVAFKANQRNLKLLKRHYLEGQYQGSALKLIIPLLLVMAIVSVLVAWP